jgi:hypothetical protein
VCSARTGPAARGFRDADARTSVLIILARGAGGDAAQRWARPSRGSSFCATANVDTQGATEEGRTTRGHSDQMSSRAQLADILAAQSNELEWPCSNNRGFRSLSARKSLPNVGQPEGGRHSAVVPWRIRPARSPRSPSHQMIVVRGLFGTAACAAPINDPCSSARSSPSPAEAALDRMSDPHVMLLVNEATTRSTRGKRRDDHRTTRA